MQTDPVHTFLPITPVEGEFAKGLYGGGVDEADFEAVQEQPDVGFCVGRSTPMPCCDSLGNRSG